MKRRRGWVSKGIIVLMAGIFFSALTGPVVAGEKFPEKTITLIVTHAAGGSTDLPARLVQPFLEKELGVPVVITNKVGAAGSIARSYVWKLSPDGYNLLVSQQPSMSTGTIISGGDYDALGFVPIYNIAGKEYQAIAVPYNSPLKDLKEFVDSAKKKEMTICGAGVGAQSWLTYVLMTNKLGVKLQYVPFNSSQEAIMAVMGGQVDALCTSYSFMPPLVEQKKIRMLGVLGSERGENAPDIPTADEEGIKGISLDQFTSIYAPPGLPQDKVKILADAFERATKNPEFLKKAKEARCTLDLMGPAKLKVAVKEIHDMIQSIKPAIEAVRDKMK